MLSVVTRIVAFVYCYAECHYADCRCAIPFVMSEIGLTQLKLFWGNFFFLVSNNF
jgi:hypothetical protein